MPGWCLVASYMVRRHGFWRLRLLMLIYYIGIFNVSASVAGSTSTSSDNPASISCAPPLLFAFHHIPIALSLSFVMVLFLGKYFELSGINQDRWGSFHILYQLVTLLLRIAVTILQWMNALLDGRIRRVDVIRTCEYFRSHIAVFSLKTCWWQSQKQHFPDKQYLTKYCTTDRTH